jgi:hypothetical protein
MYADWIAGGDGSGGFARLRWQSASAAGTSACATSLLKLN